MQQPAPSLWDDLEATLAEVWRCLGAGASTRRSAFHHPTIATMGPDGAPRLRTMILRGVEPEIRRLRFHTDIRAAKANDVAANGSVAVHIYDPGMKLQVRMTGLATISHGDATARMAWQNAQPMSKACYGTRPAPGTPIETGDGFSLPASHSPELAEGETNFAVLRMTIETMETLYLAHGGHRRAAFGWEGAALVRKDWLAP
ncbi:pyridoxamine 5'-phosphate oxidase family protein [Rhabdaerophilum sp. SD176]|uniref:pyridoxamine 5'-phosphate oxidase family protein n=1 Tax=Rhabdaerophilum sp. SD176 TaxID=2983548 RepID=UPI0024DFC0ED|nr:pyridoxamine 5'-phosphate oxidase family protein [Rhabdaerophilum sp. SD176]